MPGDVSRAIDSRRSVRHFDDEPVSRDIVEDLIRLACTAPAPHHSRPWRFVHVTSDERREALADAMSDAWRADLDAVDTPVREVDRLLRRSRTQIEEAPALLLACLALDEAKDWQDDGREQSERDMFVQSLGAALQNILLAAGDFGLVGYLKGAPLFCTDAIRTALDLPSGWEPTFLVLLGYPQPGFEPDSRPAIEITDFLIDR
ncbi:MAG: nitroreductase family protein [Chloroflexi bacterium]|nr:nitroreductase family protein [Chloroflexota bacterium]